MRDMESEWAYATSNTTHAATSNSILPPRLATGIVLGVRVPALSFLQALALPNLHTAIPMPCSFPPQAIHSEQPITAQLPSLRHYEEAIGCLPVAANAGK